MVISDIFHYRLFHSEISFKTCRL